MFSLCMGYSGGNLVIGSIENSFYSGDLYYTPIVGDKTYYCVRLLNIKVSNYKDSIDLNTQNVKTYVDSGTTLLIVPYDIFASIKATFLKLCPTDSMLNQFLCGQTNVFNLQNQKCKYFDKSIFSKLPDIRFRFPGETNNSDFEVTIIPQDYIRFFPSDDPGYDYCGQFGITALQISNNAYFDGIILGDTFMRAFYTVFDREEGKIGFATSKNCGQSPQPPNSTKRVALGIGLSFGIFLLGVFCMFLIIFVKNRREMQGRANPIALQDVAI